MKRWWKMVGERKGSGKKRKGEVSRGRERREGKGENAKNALMKALKSPCLKAIFPPAFSSSP